MLTLPDAIISILKPFAPMFQAKTWTKAHVLLVGAILATRKRAVTFITRLRMDAALYEPAPLSTARTDRSSAHQRPTAAHPQGTRRPTDNPPDRRDDPLVGILRRVEIASHTAVWYHCGKAPVPIRWVLIRDPWGEFQPQTLLCADLNVEPTRIIEWFMLRWQLEVTFQEVRTHLGVETQRQWSDRAIDRTTPVLLGLFSWITVAAHLLQKQRPSKPRADLRRRNRVGASSYVERL